MRVEHANYKGQRNVRCWRWMSDDAADSIIPVSIKPLHTTLPVVVEYLVAALAVVVVVQALLTLQLQ
jgi:hypothetical protein